VHRKVFVVEDESSIRCVVHVLLSAPQADGDAAGSGHEALAVVSRERFDSVLLDLRVSDPPPGQPAGRVCEIRPTLVGRVLFITGDVSDRRILELIEQNATRCIQGGNLMHNLWDRVRLMLGPAHSS
jgi:DNA-binding response OmpR family regulator